ncbi:myostatin-like protein [Leptotrombidium deliense]|uniref:Myostatin-like protein n=1 Tax=Leptotrombidium deliense TaxID=299467 RepID=A0A443SQ36_9ACAR|nr:myostatin-like protein [Leptotrombidium deliense]
MKLYSLSTSSASNRSAERLLAAVQPIEDTNEEVLNRENLLQTWFKWNEYNLTQILSKLVTPSDSNNQRILVDSEHLKIFSSFITIEYDYISTERVKRSIDCNPNGNSSSCCREPFYVNFTHIHWDDWILQPTGKCDISHARYHHTTVVQKYQSIISLCCSPREMSPIPLIYIDENGYVLKKILMNMVVESCDCA